MSIYYVIDDRFRGLVDETEGFDTLAEGFRFTEGAAWHPVGRHVTFSDIPSNRIHRWFADSGKTITFREPSNMTNGMAYDADGRLLMCEHASSRVSRLETDGTVSVLADRWRGNEFNSPNDIVIDEFDTIWFTDPLYGRQVETGIEREPGLPFRGVFRLDVAGRLELLDDDYDGPNGLCFSPDKHRLYVNDSERRHIRVYDISADGSAAGGAIIAETREQDRSLGWGSPDGMKVDAAGNIWCAGPGGVHVFDANGIILGVLLTPQFPANFCFGGDDMRSFFICAGTTFLRIRVKQAGHSVFAQN